MTIDNNECYQSAIHYSGALRVIGGGFCPERDEENCSIIDPTCPDFVMAVKYENSTEFEDGIQISRRSLPGHGIFQNSINVSSGGAGFRNEKRSMTPNNLAMSNASQSTVAKYHKNSDYRKDKSVSKKISDHTKTFNHILSKK